MEWTDDLVFSFVKKIQSHPCIWNPRNKNKKNRNKVHDAFKSIAEEIVGVDNVDELKKKKEALFQTYRGYRRKVCGSQKSGAGRDDIYKPTWPPYSLLDDFLHGIYTPKGRFDTLDTLDGNEELQNDDEEGADNDNETPETDFNENKETERLSNINEETHKSIKQPVKRSNVKRPRKVQDRAEVAFNELLAIKEQIGARSVGRDECTLYTELLAIKLRKLDERTQRLAMHKIDNIMFDLTFNSSMLPTSRSLSSHSSDVTATPLPSPTPSCSQYSPQPPQESRFYEQSGSNYINLVRPPAVTNEASQLQLSHLLQCISQSQCSTGLEDDMSHCSQ